MPSTVSSGGALPPEKIAAIKRYLAGGWDAKTVAVALRLSVPAVEAALRKIKADAQRIAISKDASCSIRAERTVVRMIDAARKRTETRTDALRRLVEAGLRAEAAEAKRRV